jgi:hypothetical protein
MILTGEDKNLSHVHSVLTNLTWYDLGLNPASSVRGRQLTACSTVRPSHSSLSYWLVYVCVYGYLLASVKRLLGVSTASK